MSVFYEPQHCSHIEIVGVRKNGSPQPTMLTASVGTDQPDNLWHTHITPSETLVFYMGGLHRQAVAQTLLDKGFTNDTPVVMVFGASWADEAVVRLDLSRMANNDFEQPNTDAPCIILVGKGLRV